jgi:hypothetical protein
VELVEKQVQDDIENFRSRANDARNNFRLSGAVQIIVSACIPIAAVIYQAVILLTPASTPASQTIWHAPVFALTCAVLASIVGIAKGFYGLLGFKEHSL